MTNQSLAVPTPQAIRLVPEVQELYADWLTALDRRVKSGELSPATRSTYKIGMDRFMAWRSGLDDLGPVTDDMIRDWKAAMKEKGRKPGSINTWLSGVRAFFSWAVSAHRLTLNPAIGVPGAKRSGTSTSHKRDALTDDEIVRVLAQPRRSTHTGRRDYAIMSLMAYTAVRTVEIHRANLENLRTESGKLVLAVQGKGHAEADQIVVLAHPKVVEAVMEWIAVRGQKPGPLFTSMSKISQPGRISLKFIRHMVIAYFKKAGVVGISTSKTTHSLRHSAITSAIKHGASIQQVQSMARHASIATTGIYMHETNRIENPAEAFIDYGNKE